MSRNPDELVRRLAAGLRAAELYAPQHPLVQRSIASLASSCSAHLSDDMPIWGPIFHGLDPDDRVNRIRVANIVDYIESFQMK